MQKAASFVEHDRRHDDLGTTIEQLTTEKLQLSSAIDQLKEKHRKQIEELSATIEANAARHKEEIATMLSAHDEILSSAKKDDQDVAATVTRQLQETSAQLKDATTRMQQLEMDLAAEVSSAQAANKAAAEMQQRHAAELEQLRGELDECQRRADDAVEQRERAQGEMDKLRSDNHQFTEELADLRQKLDKTQMDSAGEIERLNQYVDELKMKVDDKTDALSTALKESESLTIELAASKELSAIHERLQEELDSARRDRDETERHAQKLQAELKSVTASLETETANSQRLLAELDAAREDFHRKLNDSANNDELTEQHRREEITDL
uniref:Myosin heavy chain n=1 Tax=Plectus sambesii TaxID=2011161 RepID=A0A914UVJ4_9BILA